MSVDKLFYSAEKEKDGKLFIGVNPEKNQSGIFKCTDK